MYVNCFISDEYLDTVINDMFVAGAETTTTALRWSIVCLTEYPEIQEGLYRDITSSIGILRPPSVLDRSSLVHVEAFFMEVLRYGAC
jgi:cytochrome P450